MQVAVDSPPSSVPKRVVAIITGCLVVLGVFIAVSGDFSSSSSTYTAPSTDLAAATTDLAMIAGFPVKARYTCIDKWKRCTNFWCDANCNHVPKYCPASYCRQNPPPPPSVPPPPPPSTDDPGTPGNMCVRRSGTSAVVVDGKNTYPEFFCCAASCGTCGGSGCSKREGGGDKCCIKKIRVNGRDCKTSGPPCTIYDSSLASTDSGRADLDQSPTENGGTVATQMAAAPTELAVAPSCAAIGKAAMCDEACVSTCRGSAPGFKVAGCAIESYCTGSTPSWAKGSVCTCPPTKAPLVPTCDAAGKSSLCDVACKSTCRGDAPGFKVAGCATQKYCTTPPNWAQTSLCSCPSAKPQPPPPAADSPGSCAAGGIEGKVASRYTQSVGGSKVCCPSSCGTCGGPGCASFPGGKSNCCVGNGYKYGITASKKACSDSAPPCIMMGDETVEAN